MGALWCRNISFPEHNSAGFETQILVVIHRARLLSDPEGIAPIDPICLTTYQDNKAVGMLI